MQPFITYRDKDNQGNLQYYVLQRAYPHYVGLINRTPTPNAIAEAPIPQYELYVTFNGVLQGNYFPSYKDAREEAQQIYENMAAWFWAERIAMDKKRFEKFKIKKDVSTDTK